jgi:hypothetical protein
MNFKGAIHLHTNLSHDGKFTLEELVSFLKEQGYQFICITEHSYDIDGVKMKEQAAQCAKLSSPDFLIIPGLEFRCHDDIDILGYGVIETIDSEDPVAVIGHIRKHGGVPVLAHPAIRNYPLEKEWVSLLDGAELWNNQEGKFLPHYKTYKKFAMLAEWRPGLKAFFGIDLHRKKSYYPIATVIEAKENNREEVLKALAAGHFHLESPLMKLKSDGKINPFKLLFIISGWAILDVIRKIRG